MRIPINGANSVVQTTLIMDSKSSYMRLQQKSLPQSPSRPPHDLWHVQSSRPWHGAGGGEALGEKGWELDINK
jgi:hypothetical protein